MSTGSLLFPLGYTPLNDSGSPVPSGKLVFSRTGTSTAQDTYSDSALSSANSNPVVLNSAGRLTTKVYGDRYTGFNYRVRLLTSADVEVWSFDDVVVDPGDSATFSSGSFTGTLTGMGSATTGTITYKVFSDSIATGKLCILHVSSSITGTSNATSFTMTGLPAACQPTTAVWVPCNARDNGTDVPAAAEITTGSPSVVTFYTDSPLSSTGWTGSGTKGLVAGTSLLYAL